MRIITLTLAAVFVYFFFRSRFLNPFTNWKLTQKKEEWTEIQSLGSVAFLLKKRKKERKRQGGHFKARCKKKQRKENLTALLSPALTSLSSL